MAARVHDLTSFWLCADDWQEEDGVVLVDTIKRDDAGPTDAVKIRLPVDAFNVELLYTKDQETRSEGVLTKGPKALLLKPTMIGPTYLVFGSQPVLEQFGNLFFPF